MINDEMISFVTAAQIPQRGSEYQVLYNFIIKCNFIEILWHQYNCGSKI